MRKKLFCYRGKKLENTGPLPAQQASPRTVFNRCADGAVGVPHQGAGKCHHA